MALFSRTFVATAVLAALSLPALAQSTATNEAASAPTQTQTQTQVQTQPATAGVQTMRRAPNRAKMQERMAQRQAALKHSLELSPAQEPAWNTFITSMQPGERPARLGQLNRDEMQKLTTPERIERMRAQRAQRHAQADRRADAALAFYAELNPAQQFRPGHGQKRWQWPLATTPKPDARSSAPISHCPSLSIPTVNKKSPGALCVGAFFWLNSATL